MRRLPVWVEYAPVCRSLISRSPSPSPGLVILRRSARIRSTALRVMLEGAFVYARRARLHALLHDELDLRRARGRGRVPRSRLFNIGGEGQAYVGASRRLRLSAWLFDSWMSRLADSFRWRSSARRLFGAFWALIPGFLQAYRGSHVVITTIMFNFIAAGMMVALLGGLLRRPGQQNPESRVLDDSARLPFFHDIAEALGLEAANAPLNLALPIALAAAVGVWVLIWRTRWGYELRTVGQSEPAARYAGVAVPRVIVWAMVISGALAGLMAVNIILGGTGQSDNRLSQRLWLHRHRGGAHGPEPPCRSRPGRAVVRRSLPRRDGAGF